ncbi:hypothetical protein ACFL1X_14495 [Candidatus Hydrogenedentota bacterium]
MKPLVNLIGAFKKVEEEKGTPHFAGTLDMAALKKTKLREIELVLIPIESVPKSLVSLMKKAGTDNADLLVFATTGNEKKK